MGKYKHKENLRLMIEKYPEYPIEKYVNEASKLYFLEAIANELAETNRLKRIELLIRTQNLPSEQQKEFDKKLKDQA